MSYTLDSVSIDFYKVIDLLEKNMHKFWASYEKYLKDFPSGSKLSMPVGKHEICYNSNMFYVNDSMGYGYFTLPVTNKIFTGIGNVSFDDEDVCIRKNKHMNIFRGEYVYNRERDVIESVDEPSLVVTREQFEEWHFQFSTVNDIYSLEEMLSKIDIYQRLQPHCYGFGTIFCETYSTNADIISEIIEALY